VKTFAEQGRTLVFLNRSANYAVEHLHLDVKNVVAGVPNRDFYSPGSLVNVMLDTRNAVAHGLPENIAIWSEESPAWEVPANSRDFVVARYPDDHVLASGWLLGDSYIKGRAALVEVPVGQGLAILFGMRPQYRAQSYKRSNCFQLAGFQRCAGVLRTADRTPVRNTRTPPSPTCKTADTGGVSI